MGKSLTDPGFCQRLLDDPVTALRDDMGIALPDGFKIHVHEDNSVDAAHIVLPPSAELTGEEMSQVAGAGCDGSTDYTWDC